ncbi:MAG: hypothetical protein KIT16_10165 [Rhodospirillaceae bacterium]|nr:hypothetical protein [Rhodospirillaceae bacterium]
MNAGFFRQTTVLFIVLAIGLALVLFWVKYEVQDLEEELAQLDHEIMTERRSIHVLRAEWSSRNAPDTLGRYAKKYLELEPLSPEQMGSFVYLPWPPMNGHQPPVHRPSTGLVSVPSPYNESSEP